MIETIISLALYAFIFYVIGDIATAGMSKGINKKYRKLATWLAKSPFKLIRWLFKKIKPKKKKKQTARS